MWVARDKEGNLWLFNKIPHRLEGDWLLTDEDLITGGFYMPLEKDLFPKLTWKNEPMEVGLYLLKTHVPVNKNFYSKAIRSQLKMK